MLKKLSLALVLAACGSMMIGATVTATSVSGSCDENSGKILTFSPWYRGLTNPDCTLKSPDQLIDGNTNNPESGVRRFVWTIVVNIVDMLLQVIGYISVGYTIYGGFLLMTSDGSPDKAARARKTILYAVIGVGIAIASVGLVNLIARAVGLLS